MLKTKLVLASRVTLRQIRRVAMTHRSASDYLNPVFDAK
jgi:hypothetical protein